MEIRFSGECTVERFHELRQLLVDAVNSGESITVDLGHVDQADITFFQLLESARNSVPEQQTFSINMNNVSKNIIQKAYWSGVKEFAAHMPD